MLDPRSIGIIGTAVFLAVLCVLPSTKEIAPLWIIASGMRIADTLFHELGHAVFSWLFGRPSIPMIFTLFGADQAGGMAWTWERSWFVQAGVFALLAYGCYWAKENWEVMFIPIVIFSLFIIITAFTSFYEIIPLFMGHGGSMLMGGFFLFRAFIYLDARNEYERWLNGFFGAYLMLHNIHFAYTLFSFAEARDIYSEAMIFGAAHHDFMAMTNIIYSWSIKGIALFAFIYGILIAVASFVAAILLRDRFYATDERPQ